MKIRWGKELLNLMVSVTIYIIPITCAKREYIECVGLFELSLERIICCSIMVIMILLLKLERMGYCSTDSF